ncbi:MAG: hypothetical protein HOQ17_05975 [Gemmatimonadaceae bacterium]|nr:hypothetical protein [Gemmatimonadaceae bacterium]NUO93220.1 hypothetical protein [Gemmatimonadaceae bacterium]NUP55468.1 hypothetical protein [Gemmatimonadaceae bacterium]NUP71683.1 hypothetical protein [Gemmatimonadaceae bacterium]NUR32773.1 hypothetical protein [Gemmatimonadaceae bacterium]
MPLFSRRGDPMLDQIARDTFALFPNCHRCGQRVARFEDADVRVLVQRIVHRGPCPVAGAADDAFEDMQPPAGTEHRPA